MARWVCNTIDFGVPVREMLKLKVPVDTHAHFFGRSVNHLFTVWLGMWSQSCPVKDGVFACKLLRNEDSRKPENAQAFHAR